MIPNNNVAGFTSARFVSDAHTITTLSIDLSITHPEMGEITAVLTSPSGTSVTIYDGDHAGQADFDGNLGWDYQINSGDLYSFYDETTDGTWTLTVTDTVDANADGDVFSGTLDGWTMHFNEDWDGEIFVGDNVTVQETIAVRGELRVEYGGDFVMTNTDGDETLRLSAETPSTVFTSSSFPDKIYTIASSTTSYSWSWHWVSADCNAGDMLLSGVCTTDGGRIDQFEYNRARTTDSLPSGWECYAYGYGMKVTGICLDLSTD